MSNGHVEKWLRNDQIGWYVECYLEIRNFNSMTRWIKSIYVLYSEAATILYSEAATGGVLSEKVFLEGLEILQNSQACNFIKKETLAQVFSREFCEISENTFLT